MSNSRCDLSAELERRLTPSEYEAAREYLDNACYWCEQGNDERVRDFLICAISELKSKGEMHAAKIIKDDYLIFF